MKLVSNLVMAVGLALSAFLGQALPATAGSFEVRIYESHRSYHHHRRVTVFSGYHGHRVYRPRLYRPGYVYHRGHWISPRSMRSGVIVDRPIPRRHVVHYGGGLNARHYSWCADRYRSYHWRSNSFQPYHGPRRACLSPFY